MCGNLYLEMTVGYGVCMQDTMTKLGIRDWIKTLLQSSQRVIWDETFHDFHPSSRNYIFLQIIFVLNTDTFCIYVVSVLHDRFLCLRERKLNDFIIECIVHNTVHDT